MKAKILLTIIVALSFLSSSISMAAESRIPKNSAEETKTKFDHIGLAGYYENEANVLSKKVEEQKELLKEYENHSEYYGREGQDFQSHHEALLQKYMKAIERNLGMAALHRKMAADMK